MVGITGWTTGLFIPNQRSIGMIVAEVTIQEVEHDQLQITEHPVEQGAPISDHAFKRPSTVNIRAGWSKDGSGNLSASGNGVYGLLLAWQAALVPFELYTGKRHYSDMLIQSITVTTDEASEYSLMADIVCQQVIIVSTSTTQVSSSASSNNPANQANPEANAPPSDQGTAPTKSVSVPNTNAIDHVTSLNVPNTSLIDKGIAVPQ